MPLVSETPRCCWGLPVFWGKAKSGAPKDWFLSWIWRASKSSVCKQLFDSDWLWKVVVCMWWSPSLLIPLIFHILRENFRSDCTLCSRTLHFLSICTASSTTGLRLEPLCAALTLRTYNRNNVIKMSLQFAFSIMIVWLYCHLWIKSMSFLYHREYILLLKKQFNF